MKKSGMIAWLVVLLVAVAAYPCTVFMASDGIRILVGNNEDYFNPLTKVTFVPAEEGKYGAVYFGFAVAWQQGGMNDQGLVFDWAATDPVELKPSEGKEPFAGNLIEKMMQDCRTVAEALALLDRYEARVFERAQLFLADRDGNSVIVEGDAVLPKQGRYQILTNFRQSRTPADQIRCQRFIIADQMLTRYPVTVDHLRAVLSATHQEMGSPTQYSMVYDPREMMIHLFHFHNFENQLQIDVGRELTKERRVIDIETLFPKTHAYDVYKAQWMQRMNAQSEKRDGEGR